MTAKARVLQTLVRDCLYLNWAFPAQALPSLPEPLRYEEHVEGNQRFVFGSALLFRHESLRLAGLPILRVSYPQFHFRLYVRDHEGVPSVYFQRVLVPGWVVPSARWIARQPALTARFAYPRPSTDPDREEWIWDVAREGHLRLATRKSSPRTGSIPSLGSWQSTVDYFRLRRRGYVAGRGGLRTIETSQQSVQLLPLEVAFQDRQLLASCLSLRDRAAWPELHSAWLCPRIPFVFELSADTVRETLRRSAAPVAPDPAMFQAEPKWSQRPAA